MLSGTSIQEDAAALKAIAEWLNRQTGIFYPERKLDTLKHKLFKVCLDNRMSLHELHDLLQNGNGNTGGLALQIVAAASTNHTAFFREDIWGSFREEILPDALNRNGRVRIWSAAASSGEEAYTIAMVAAELIGATEAGRRLAILGTDISFRTLKTAEDAVYPKDRLKNIPESYVQRYFTRLPGREEVRINDCLRSMCLFRRLNLKKRPYPFKNRFGIIFCRNVLYYFAQEERERIVNALYDFAEPGGWLIVSVTESLGSMKTRWKRVAGKTGIYRKL